MLENRKVSIIVPVFNAEKFISNTIESIINQSYKNIELILINDGSTDNSLEVCQSYSDSRIKILSIQNSGPSIARNRALEEVLGDYIMFVDSDDHIEPNMIEVMVGLMTNTDLAMCSYTSVFKNGRISRNAIPYSGSVNYLWNNYSQLYKDLIIQYIWNKTYRTDVIRKNRLKFDESIKRGEDILFNLEYFKYIDKVNITDNSLYNYIRYNSNSITLSYNPNMFDEQETLFSSIRERLKKLKVYESNRVILNELYINRIKLSITNLYLQGSPLNKRQRIGEVNRIIKSDQFIKSLREYNSNNWKHVLLKTLVLTNSARIINFVYDLKNKKKIVDF